jgi:hypothetical protein
MKFITGKENRRDKRRHGKADKPKELFQILEGEGRGG